MATWPYGLAVLTALLPAAACGQAAPQPKALQTARTAAGMTVQHFTARRERRLLAGDTDGDGRVSRAEFLASATTGKGDPARRFGRLDRNGDGAIDQTEIAAMLGRRVVWLDTDGNGVLTPAERAAARERNRSVPDG